VKDESLEDTMVGSYDIFDTPRMVCLKLKTEFLRKARNYKFWGFNKSRQRVTALDTFARYCMQSMEVAKGETKLMNDVREDIQSFMLEHVLPLPHSLREKLNSAKDANEEQFGPFCLETEAMFIRDELENLRDEALAEFENEEWSSQEEFHQYTFELRALRKRIYQSNNDNLLNDFLDYDVHVENFLKQFRKILGKRCVDIWKRKLRDTAKFAQGILGFSMINASADEFEPNVSADVEDIETNSKSVVFTQEKFDNPVPEETLQLKSLVPEVEEVFVAARHHNSVDLDIEARLLKIKFFRNTWCCSEPGSETKPGKMTPPLVAKISKPNRNMAAESDVPVYSTKEDSKDFNNWYLEQIGVILPPPSYVFGVKDKTGAGAGVQKVPDLVVTPTDPMNQLKAEYNSLKQEKNIDEEPILMPCVNMDEDEVDNAMSLVNPSISNKFEWSNFVHSNVPMENMLVIFLTILRMLYITQPKLSYVPALFPTQSQSLPDPSVPSCACANTMDPVEVRLTRSSCQAVGQVISDLTRGSTSWLRDRVWQILQRRKIAAGLMFIQVGEMLLA
jgi:hypothetical protein